MKEEELRKLTREVATGEVPATHAVEKLASEVRRLNDSLRLRDQLLGMWREPMTGSPLDELSRRKRPRK
ncbi:hypothetical protein [Vulgatibacter sp.]|uniref:hypothetical protein n=1 Tax=Vulgatibacter sp. TaxID=1971226 RepID=UPI0035622AFD